MKEEKQLKKSALLFMILILAVVSTNIFAANGNSTTITFWNGFTGPDGEILREIVNRFNQEQAGKINVEMDIMPWDVFFQKLPPAIATKTAPDRKSTRLNSSHVRISYAVFCLKKKMTN